MPEEQLQEELMQTSFPSELNQNGGGLMGETLPVSGEVGVVSVVAPPVVTEPSVREMGVGFDGSIHTPTVEERPGGVVQLRMERLSEVL